MNSVNELNKLQHNERSRYSDQSEIRVLTMGGTLVALVCLEKKILIAYRWFVECLHGKLSSYFYKILESAGLSLHDVCRIEQTSENRMHCIFF